MATVQELAKKLNKDYKDSNLCMMASLTPEYEKLATGALGLDYITFGGVPLGRIIEFSGQPHSGKTTAAWLLLAAYQKKYPNKICVYCDLEHGTDRDFQARMNHVDMSKVMYYNPTAQSAESICQDILDFEQTDNIGMIVIDSLPSLIPNIDLENDFAKDNGMRSSPAKLLFKFLKAMSNLLIAKGNILLLINQARLEGKTFTGAPIYAEACGSAANYYSSMILRFGTRKWIKGDDNDACKKDNGESATGFRLVYKIVKSRTSPCTRGGGFISYDFGKGLDWTRDLFEIAFNFNFIERINNMTYALVNLATGEVYKDDKGEDLQGKKTELMQYLETHEDFKKEYLDMLNTFISKPNQSFGNLLDENTDAEINKEQQAVDTK